MATLDDETRGTKGRALKLKSQHAIDIFGNEFVGAKQILRMDLNHSDLPEGARFLIATVTRFDLPESILSAAISEALGQVSRDFWEYKIEGLTPLEWKLLAALKDPEFRSEVESILNLSPLPQLKT